MMGGASRSMRARSLVDSMAHCGHGIVTTSFLDRKSACLHLWVLRVALVSVLNIITLLAKEECRGLGAPGLEVVLGVFYEDICIKCVSKSF